MRKTYYSKHGSRFHIPTKKIIGVICIAVGVIGFIYFFYPLLSLNLYFSKSSNLTFPLPKYHVLTSVASQGVAFFTNLDDARNWYPTVPEHGKQPIPSYSLSIPKIGIENSTVSTIDYDLSKHLVQYFGTVLPGEKGSAVIFGHSTLPNLFNPTDYKTIFAKLHLVKKGDEISVSVNGIVYTYQVDSIAITDPSDTSMFSQNYDTSNITLITCTPPGTIWKRLVVKAKLQALKEKTVYNNKWHVRIS